MADFEGIVKKHVDEAGNISASAINALVAAIKNAVGNEFVDKERYKAKLTEIDQLKEKQQTAEDNAATAEKWKTKFEGLKSEFEAYKTEQENKETHMAKEEAYRNLLKQAGISEKRLESVLRVSRVDDMELDGNGGMKGADKLVEQIRQEWADFITTTTVKGADTANPPVTGPDKAYSAADIRKMTPAEINQNFDAIKASLKGEH